MGDDRDGEVNAEGEWWEPIELERDDWSETDDYEWWSDLADEGEW